MAVITADGIVGKVLQVFPSVSQVLLINDQSSGVGTILEKSRLQGFLKGTATGEVVLEGVMSDEQVAPGERVLTSGGDQIFPKGLPVGTVTKVGTGKDLFLNIGIKPAVNLGKLEEVLVVVEKQERQAQTADVGRVRAADILAQRLPSVPDKPAAVTNGPTTVPAGAVATAGAPNGKPRTGEASVPVSPVATPKAVAPKPVPPGAETVAKPPVKSPSAGVVAGSKPGSATATQPKRSTASTEPDPGKVDPGKVDPGKVDPATNSQDSPH
jgi:rod shape-determining protein MreC